MADEEKPTEGGTDDELDALLNAAPAADAAPAGDEAETITMTKTEAEELRATARNVTSLTEQVGNLSSQLSQARQPAAPAPAPEGTLTAEELFASPSAVIDARVQKGIAAAVAPAAAQFAGQIASMALQNFKRDKSGDPLYSGVLPLFNTKMGRFQMSWLGSLSESDLNAALAEAWNASVGEYVVQERGKKKPKAANIGGGAAGGGGSAKTLQELDPVSYRWAMENGLSEDDMKDIAKDIQTKKDDE